MLRSVQETFKDIDLSKSYNVDFELDEQMFNVGFVKSVDDLKSYYGTGFKEPFVAVKNILINKNDIQVMGKEKNSWKLINENNIAFVKFKCSSDDIVLNWINDEFSDEDEKEITVVGRCNINFFNGILMPQLVIEEYEMM